MTNEKLEEIRKRDACSWASSSSYAQANYDRSALIEEVDRLRAVLREAVQEREREIMEDMVHTALSASEDAVKKHVADCHASQPPAGKSPTGRAERLVEELRNAERALKDARIEAELMRENSKAHWLMTASAVVGKWIKELEENEK